MYDLRTVALTVTCWLLSASWAFSTWTFSLKRPAMDGVKTNPETSRLPKGSMMP